MIEPFFWKLDFWREMIGLGEEWPSVGVFSLVVLLISGGILAPFAAGFSYVQRKMVADLQARVGPNRAGSYGLLQSLADFLKLISKGVVRRQGRQEVFQLLIINVFLYASLATLPLGSLFVLVDTEMSTFIPLISIGGVALGTMLLGFDRGIWVGWLGGVRVASQAIAGFFPSLLSLFAAGTIAGGYQWEKFASVQGFFPTQWILFRNPFMPVLFLIFVMSGLIVLSSEGMASGVSKIDLGGGVARGLYGRRLSLFSFGRFYSFFLWNTAAVVVFCGAWNLPRSVETGFQYRGQDLPQYFFEICIVLFKVAVLMMVILLISRVNPKLRSDQITDLTWKVLSPIALLGLVGVVIWTWFWRGI